MAKPSFLEAIDQRVLVCDGAMGTMLYAKGIFLNRSFDELNVKEPDLVSDVHQAYVRVGGAREFPLSLKLGRQEMSYGDERLIGAFDWNNIGRVFDGVAPDHRVEERHANAHHAVSPVTLSERIAEHLVQFIDLVELFTEELREFLRG